MRIHQTSPIPVLRLCILPGVICPLARRTVPDSGLKSQISLGVIGPLIKRTSSRSGRLRPGADLVLKLAEREASEKECMKFTVDLLAGALASVPENQTPDLPIHLMVRTFPWMEFLPE
jgi:hypothetical protein